MTAAAMNTPMTFYLNGCYGIPITAVHNPPHSISLDSLNAEQIDQIAQLQLQFNTMENAARIYSWLEAQSETPGSIFSLPLQDYFFNANFLPLTLEVDGDMFIRSESL
jgi:hypothetical protein